MFFFTSKAAIKLIHKTQNQKDVTNECFVYRCQLKNVAEQKRAKLCGWTKCLKGWVRISVVDTVAQITRL